MDKGGVSIEAILDATADGIIAIDAKGIITTFNRSAERIFGYSGAEAVGRNVSILMPAPYRDEHDGYLERYVRTGDARVLGREREVEGRRKDGTTFPLAIRVTEINQGGRRTFIGVTQDITERKRARDDLQAAKAKLEHYAHDLEERVRASEERYRTLVEHANDAILTLDTEGRILQANRRTEEFLGYPRADLVGRAFGEWVVEDDRSSTASALDALLHTGSAFTQDVRLRRRDGRIASVHVSAALVPTNEGPVVVAILHDVTEQREAQSQLLMSDRMVSVGTLAAGVAHEINNPLAAVVANLEVLHRAFSANNGSGGRSWPVRNAEIDEPLRDAREAAERVRQIVRDIKTMSRSDETRREPLDVRRVLDVALRMASNEIRHRARTVKDYGAVPPVDANEGRLGQVFLNLLVNAAQALPEGLADQNEVRVVTRTDGRGRAVVEIRDTGAGIPREVVPRIFDPFFTTKPVGEGTGLGLSICHRIVMESGGEIAVESAVGNGTTFRVTLPASRFETLPPAAPRSSVGQPASRRGCVLVVDDEPMIAAAVRRTLSLDHDVTAATSAKEALSRLISGERFDVILCDLMMPQMTGMDLHAELVRTAPEQAARVIFVTGGAFTPRARAFLDRVPNQRLEKPFDGNQLRALINERVR